MPTTHSKLLIINSANRTTGTPSDFTVAFHDGCVHAEQDEALKLIVVDACMSRSFYTVSSSNNTFSVILNLGGFGAFAQAYQIPVGFYDVNTFKAQLLTMLGSYWTITWSAQTGCYTFTYNNPGNNSSTTIAFAFGNNRCSELFGYGVFVGVTPQNQAVIPWNSPFPAKMNKENSVMVHCDVAKRPCAVMDNCKSLVFVESDVILKICNTYAPFDTMTYQNQGNDNFSMDLAVSNITAMRFYLTDENGAPLTQVFDWSMTLKVVFTRGDDDDLLQVMTEMKEYLNLMVLNDHMKNKIS